MHPRTPRGRPAVLARRTGGSQVRGCSSHLTCQGAHCSGRRNFQQTVCAGQVTRRGEAGGVVLVEVTDRVGRMETVEEHIGITLEALYATYAYNDEGNNLRVNFDVVSTNGTALDSDVR